MYIEISMESNKVQSRLTAKGGEISEYEQDLVSCTSSKLVVFRCECYYKVSLKFFKAISICFMLHSALTMLESKNRRK